MDRSDWFWFGVTIAWVAGSIGIVWAFGDSWTFLGDECEATGECSNVRGQGVALVAMIAVGMAAISSAMRVVDRVRARGELPPPP